MTPTSPLNNPTVLVTISGPDAPGITSELTGILAQGSVTILDIGQAVIHGLLSLSILFRIENSPQGDKAIIKDLLFKATELGMKLDFRVIPEEEKLPAATSTKPSEKTYRYALTLIAEQISAHALHDVTAVIAKYGLNIAIIERLSEGQFGCVELIVQSTKELDRSAMKKELLAIAKDKGVDIALQAEGLYRRAKRMVVMDMDSTLIQNEAIDEFAREKGVYEEVAAITEEAMKGGMDYDESLRLRCSKLKGVDQKDIDNVLKRIQLTPGADDLIRVLKNLGYRVALISGGFNCITDRFKERLDIDYAYANTLEMENGRATGRVIPPIVNAQRKADLLELIAQREGISLDQVIAIGDGANDLLMLEKAGLGIAFNAKPAVRAQADMALNQKNLRSILYLLGISGRDLTDVLGELNR